jgi:hypothetical protein
VKNHHEIELEALAVAWQTEDMARVRNFIETQKPPLVQESETKSKMEKIDNKTKKRKSKINESDILVEVKIMDNLKEGCASINYMYKMAGILMPRELSAPDNIAHFTGSKAADPKYLYDASVNSVQDALVSIGI